MTMVDVRRRSAARILVVEDEPGIALGLEDSLRLEGYDGALPRMQEEAPGGHERPFGN